MPPGEIAAVVALKTVIIAAAPYVRDLIVEMHRRGYGQLRRIIGKRV